MRKQKSERKRKVQKSLKFHLIYTACVVCVPVFLALFFIVNVSIFLIQEKIAEDSREMLSMNVQMMDEELQKVSSYLKEDNGVSPEMEGFLSGNQWEEYKSEVSSMWITTYAIYLKREKVFVVLQKTAGISIYVKQSRKRLKKNRKNFTEPGTTGKTERFMIPIF